MGSRRRRYGFPEKTIWVPGQDDNVSSRGRYLFPGGTIRSDEVTSREATPRPLLGATRAISSRAGRYKRGGVTIGRVISFTFPTGRHGDPCRQQFLQKDDIGHAARRTTAAYRPSGKV